jgi:glycosyltransferase involved in cell wall biosynthesis
MYTVGIGITTRNRVDLLEKACSSIKQFTECKDVKLIVVDDSDSDTQHLSEAVSNKHGFNYYHGGVRKGIAGAKNVCLRNLKDCDFVFLFDDDCFPIQFGWDTYVINAHLKTGIHHFNLLDEKIHGIRQKHAFDDIIITHHNILGGVMMFLTKQIVESVGAFNHNYGIYGYEHASYTYRAFRTGLCGRFGLYLSIEGLQDYLLSLDCAAHKTNQHHQYYKDNYEGTFESSMHKERDKLNSYISDNQQVYLSELDGPIYIEL